jgi:caa(3)-type oxidase subunit IV
MADSHSPAEHAGPTEHHGPNVQAYLIVFAALCVFTAVSFIVNEFVRGGSLSAHTGMAIIMAVAVVKATLVGMIFMHLKWDWPRVYFIIVPVAILCVMMIIVLMPDGVVGWPNEKVEAQTTTKAEHK